MSKILRPVAYSSCIKCGKPYPTKEFFKGLVCIICLHLEDQIAKLKS